MLSEIRVRCRPCSKDIDVLVMMRGGGSLESFAAFNNEVLVRAVADFPVPVITGIGHDKDVPLVSLVSGQVSFLHQLLSQTCSIQHGWRKLSESLTWLPKRLFLDMSREFAMSVLSSRIHKYRLNTDFLFCLKHFELPKRHSGMHWSESSTEYSKSKTSF